jgi:hypothetical protein
MPWRQTRGAKADLHLFLTSVSDRGEMLTPCPGHFTPRKEPRYPMYRRLGGYPSQARCFRREKSLAPARIWTPHHPACSTHYTNYFIWITEFKFLPATSNRNQMYNESSGTQTMRTWRKVWHKWSRWKGCCSTGSNV